MSEALTGELLLPIEHWDTLAHYDPPEVTRRASVVVLHGTITSCTKAALRLVEERPTVAIAVADHDGFGPSAPVVVRGSLYWKVGLHLPTR